MKKQTKHSIKAHLLWSALILLALLAVCAIPFALAQSRSRGTSKQNVAKTNAPANMYNPQVANRADGAVSDQPLPNISQTGQSQLSNEATSGPSGVQATGILPGPKAPQVVLYDQYDNDLNNGIVSANRTDNTSLSAEAADNFVVPSGQTWTVNEVDIRAPAGFPAPTSFAVTFYLDNGSGLPGTQVYTASGLAVTGNPDYIITLTVPAVLATGTYWVSAVGTITGSNWYWEGRSVTNNTYATAWRNPGGGYGLGCTDWARLQDCIGFSWPDQMFRIVGTVGGSTPTPTPTATAGQCSWGAGPDMPTVLVRAVGVYFPDGNFYTMGGRTSDAAGSDFQHVLKYSPISNTWTQMGVTLPDNQMNNMACGVLTLGGTPYIYCVGGSAAGQTTATARVFYYNPATDTVTPLTAADNWPGDAAGTILPGGFAETGNKMYILGGFNINVASTNQIWQFDPTAAVGAKWTQMVNTPEGVMYAPTCTIGGIVYLAGASDYSGGTVIDTTNSFSFNPGTNTTGT